RAQGMLVADVRPETPREGLVASGVSEGVSGDLEELRALLIDQGVQVGAREDLACPLFRQPSLRDEGGDEQEGMHRVRDPNMPRPLGNGAIQGGGGTPSGGGRRSPSNARTSARRRRDLRSSSSRPRTWTREGSTAAARRRKATASSGRSESAAVAAAL